MTEQKGTKTVQEVCAIVTQLVTAQEELQKEEAMHLANLHRQGESTDDEEGSRAGTATVSSPTHSQAAGVQVGSHEVTATVTVLSPTHTQATEEVGYEEDVARKSDEDQKSDDGDVAWKTDEARNNDVPLRDMSPPHQIVPLELNFDEPEPSDIFPAVPSPPHAPQSSLPAHVHTPMDVSVSPSKDPNSKLSILAELCEKVQSVPVSPPKRACT